MTQEECKLLREYLNLPVATKQVMFDSRIYYDTLGISPFFSQVAEDEIYFDQSWDFLMPVVKKIMDFKDKFGRDINHYKESKGWCAYYAIPSFLEMVEIGRVYKYCIEFIEWENKFIKPLI